MGKSDGRVPADACERAQIADHVGSQTGRKGIVRMRPAIHFLGEVWVNERGLAGRSAANPSSCLVAGARNHLPANRPLGFRFEVTA